jgi:hypothetical protein
MSFKDKYLKYKNKYLNIKQIGQRCNASLNLEGQRCNASLNLEGGSKEKLSSNSIKNYTYILVNSNGTIIGEENYKNIYNNIILKYHYPICLNATLELTEAEKNSIKTDEFAFIKTKITIPDIEIFQIPRILYDMFLLLSRYTKLLDSENDLKSFKFDRVFLNINYIEYCNHLNNLHQEIFEEIWKLNNYIIKYLQNKKINLKKMTYLEYTSILNLIIRDYIDLKLKLLIINQEIKKEFEILKIKPKVQPILTKNQEINKDIEILEKNAKIELMQIKNYPDTKLMLNKINIKYITDNFIKIINNINKKLLHKVLIEETISSLNSKNKLILYRGAQDTKESVINENNNNQGYSLSYNTSILNGFFHDITACTYYFMDNLMQSENMYKHYYNLNRFFYGDNSVEDNLFFIPPFHPYLQMISEDEFWHARSKVFTGSEINNLPYFAQYYDDYDDDYIPEKFEDFLQTIEAILDTPSKIFIGKYTNETTMPIYTKIHEILLNHQESINTINDLSEVLEIIDDEIDILYLYKKLYPLKYDRVGYPDSKFPDYLTSKYDKTKMDNEFKKFINSHRSQIQDTAEIEHVESNLFGGNIL